MTSAESDPERAEKAYYRGGRAGEGRRMYTVLAGVKRYDFSGGDLSNVYREFNTHLCETLKIKAIA